MGAGSLIKMRDSYAVCSLFSMKNISLLTWLTKTPHFWFYIFKGWPLLRERGWTSTINGSYNIELSLIVQYNTYHSSLSFAYKIAFMNLWYSHLCVYRKNYIYSVRPLSANLRIIRMKYMTERLLIMYVYTLQSDSSRGDWSCIEPRNI